MSNPKILIYLEQYGYGGVDTHLANLINNWPDKNYQFIIITNSDNEGIEFLKNLLQKENFLIHKINVFSFSKSKFNFINYLKLIFSLIAFGIKFSKTINKINPNYILINQGGFPAGLSGSLASIISKIKYISLMKLSIFLSIS